MCKGTGVRKHDVSQIVNALWSGLLELVFREMVLGTKQCHFLGQMTHKQPQVVMSRHPLYLVEPPQSESVVESKKTLLACLQPAHSLSESSSSLQSAWQAADELVNGHTKPEDAHST